MSTNMRRSFDFVNIAGGVYHDVTDDLTATSYNVNLSDTVNQQPIPVTT